ncbi:helix-turn-helix domain-containing protein [Streptomyces sp. NPDC048516]|uniref:AraC-like ligand-binding domain-containing protein n=1 Tax=Streptomyces sp. NPDC048516 TaxID=3365565 RepID=UPI00371CB0CB
MLGEMVFRSDDVAPADRFDYWREQVVGSFMPMEVLSDHVTDFAVSQRIVDLGAVRLRTTEHTPMTLRRTAQLVRRSDPEHYHLSLATSGSAKVVDPGGDAWYGVGDLIIMDTSRPHHVEMDSGESQDQVRGTGLFVPRELLPLPAKGVEKLINRPMSGREGVGALLAQFLTQVCRDSGSYRPADGPRLGTVALDLVSTLLAHTLDEDTLAPETRRRTLLLRIQAFIQQRLADPDLTPSLVAAAHHISLSYLYRVFEDEEATVAAWIRRQRLERARRDLADTALRHTPVHTIAARWGFPRAADFTRAFRTAYGMPPTDYRNEVCRAAE